MKRITIIGGGLAGCEAAWQAVKQNCKVTLFEMKPKQYSPAHHSPQLAELVCSNSLRSDAPDSAVGLLKEEMTRLGSVVMKAARKTAVPAGKALAVDREKFARKITRMIEEHPLIEVTREELPTLPSSMDNITILATGPLTSDSMSESLIRLTGKERLAFYDAIAPIVDSDSLNMDIVYQKSLYDDGPGDYLNCPMDREQYELFIGELADGNSVPLKDFEDPKYFEGCLPIEVMLARGKDTLRFGPMKPVGLPAPRTGKDPYAVVQLRKENLSGSLYNMVGFQTKLTYMEQKRIFRLIPGMEQVKFVRLGSIHRNTFVCAPELLDDTLQVTSRPDILLAGQLTGVEGYVESAAMGILAGINGARIILGKEPITPPKETALGALVNHLTNSDPARFQPSNINFGLFPPWEKKVPKRLRGSKRAQIAHSALTQWMNEIKLEEDG